MSFYENQATILRDLQDANLLRRFRVRENRVSVQVIDPHHVVSFGPDHIELVALMPEARFDVLEEAAKRVWDALDPQKVGRAIIRFQFLTPCQGTYDEARREAADRLVAWPEGAQNVDFAMLGDLRDDQAKAEVHYECGIVEQAEAAGRLAVQQQGMEDDGAPAAGLFRVDTLPEVAVYDGQDWRVAAGARNSAEGLSVLWSTTRQRAETLDLALCRKLLGRDK